jgi:D-amino-acid dehydrogenase
MYPALKESYPEDQLSMWMGHRPSTPDSLPVIGRSRRSPDVVYAFGHGHVGMAASPMTGKIVSEIIDNQNTSIDIAPFNPARFA